MTRTIKAIWLAALLVGLPAVANAAPPDTAPGQKMQTDTKGEPGASGYTKEGTPPGQNPAQRADPGASEYAPGQQPNDTAEPGHSESAPGQKK